MIITPDKMLELLERKHDTLVMSDGVKVERLEKDVLGTWRVHYADGDNLPFLACGYTVYKFTSARTCTQGTL